MTYLKSITPKSLKGLLLTFLVILCLPVVQARAGDYEVTYAIEAYGVAEEGKSTECTYKSSCSLKFEKSKISIMILFRAGAFDIRIYGHSYAHNGCCYFAFGDDSARINDDQQLHSLPIFEGRKRQENEYVMNRRVGELFLELRSLTPAPRTGPPPFSCQPCRTRW
jgi:hypothetical protein